MKKLLIAVAIATSGFAVGGASVSAAPSLGGSPTTVPPQCLVDDSIPGVGADDVFPCVNVEGPVTGAYPAQLPPVTPAPPDTAAPPVTVTPTTAVQVRGPLPVTGSDSNGSLQAAGLAVATGAGLVFVTRRRRRHADAA